ncbi:response regulator [Bdellovibrio reynosensis]|uniref:Response regulator n=1 Tax=Bdellovibrio reynosensis TaxID=2835041 RepID=A0ABY4CA60_9BACT|nr:response regulator [Bdellovibrio reynosensis]UOF00571.1 response regulator [Bdellovibrio reynosensis]
MIHIVIVDDEADTHLLYKLKFKKLFASIGELNLVSFLSAPETLDYLNKPTTPPVDLILSDINMPDMDGFELLQELRKNHSKIPVYMVSAYESPEYRMKAASLGAARFLSKPVDFHTLIEMIKKDLQLG